MLLISFSIMFLFCALAILSRKHFSKYKGRPFMRLFLAIGEWIYNILFKKRDIRFFDEYVKKLQVLSPMEHKKRVTKYTVEMISQIVFIFTSTNLLVMSISIIGICKPESNQIVIERNDYSEETVNHKLYLEVDNTTECITISVSPVEYTETEFYEKANSVISDIDDSIVGENSDCEHITRDLYMPTSDESGLLGISWVTDNPELISATGRVDNTEITSNRTVVLTATITYLNYEVSSNYTMMVIPVVEENSNKASVIEKLSELERDTRTSRKLSIPSELDGARIISQKGEKDTGVQITMLGIVVAVVMTMLRISKMKENMKKRDELLIMEYPEFVNELSLLLGAGMNTDAALRYMIMKHPQESSYLKDELIYTINQLDLGLNEAYCYEMLGTRICLTEYKRLMNNISRNLRMGTKDLLRIMDEEQTTALQLRRKLAKKQGEEASTKLLIPMIVELVIILLIILLPAILTF